ncbi:MAG: hypothetical protein MZU91_00005 [Desulfosudis oleivorans]|nr:hypothetical protein [Desulfosudis oleivorans]
MTADARGCGIGDDGNRVGQRDDGEQEAGHGTLGFCIHGPGHHGDGGSGQGTPWRRATARWEDRSSKAQHQGALASREASKVMRTVEMSQGKRTWSVVIQEEASLMIAKDPILRLAYFKGDQAQGEGW